MKSRALGLIFILLIPLAAAAAPWLDDTYDIFLTSKLKRAATSYRDYPVFWWNFFVFEKGPQDGDAKAAAEKMCDELGRMEIKGLRKLPCHFDASSMREFAESYLGDTPLRRPFPGADEFKKIYSGTLGKAALPLPREILEWLRLDPLDELSALKDKLQGRALGKLEAQGPYLYEASSGRILLPVQFDFPPNQSTDSHRINGIIKDLCKMDPRCPGVTLFGAHAGSMENEFQVREDIETVSLVGTLSLIALIVFIIWTRRYPLLYLLPIMGVTLFISGLITVLVFGSIHAISLSFGPGLVGLAMDYGIHASFLDPRSKHTWRSNFMALITSLVIMVLLGMSAIPLLRQMMFFGAVGLTLTYFAFYFLLTRWPDIFMVKPFGLTPRPWRPLEIISVVLILGSGLVFLQPLKLDLKQLNFETPKTAELTKWFFSKSGEGAPYILPESPDVHEWAGGQKIRYEGPSNLIPTRDEQLKNLQTWIKPCQDGLFKNDPQAARFFDPFNDLACANLTEETLDLPGPAYLRDFNNGREWTAILFPANENETAEIKARFPDARSPREMIAEFPRTFAAELAWMLPIAMLGALAFLIFHYRHLGLALLACVPFATGVGGFALLAYPFNLPLTFVSLAGLLMVFGFSLDYGIFAVDYMLEPSKERQGVWSALTICAVSTTAGFTPMAMGQHPVLHNLGHALLWGSVGTFIGTFWGVPAGYRLFFSRPTKKAAA